MKDCKSFYSYLNLPHLFFFSNLSEATPEELNFAVEMMNFLSWLVTQCPTVLVSSQWDFLLCSMLAWLEVRWKSYVVL